MVERRPHTLAHAVEVSKRDAPGGYADEPVVVESVARFVGAALGAGDAAVVIATRPHLRELEHRLRVRGLDLDIISTEGRYVPLDVDDTLERLMRNDLPDARLFDELIGGLITGAVDGQRVIVHTFDEMAPVLADRGKPQAARRIDELWSELASTVPFDRWGS